MPLPPDVVRAKERMDLADAALRADVETGGPYNGERRNRLIDILRRAIDEYVGKMARLSV